MQFSYPLAPVVTPDLRGFYRIGHKEYHAGPGLSSSRLKKALVSYASYIQDTDDDSSALAFGRAFHAAMLEPEIYKANFIVIDAHKNSNAYKSAVQTAAEQGREVLSVDDAELIQEMVKATKAHPHFQTICGSHDPEIAAFATCPETGAFLKCKADLLGRHIVDFKTTSSGTTPSDFMRDVLRYRYHLSAAFYQDVIAAASSAKLPFFLVAVAKKAPYNVEFFRLSDDLIDQGRLLYKAALRRIAKWTSTPESRAVKDVHILENSARVQFDTRDTLIFLGNP